MVTVSYLCLKCHDICCVLSAGKSLRSVDIYFISIAFKINFHSFRGGIHFHIKLGTYSLLFLLISLGDYAG